MLCATAYLFCMWMCLFAHQSNARGTVKDKANFKVEEDVTALRGAIEGIGMRTQYCAEVSAEPVYMWL